MSIKILILEPENLKFATLSSHVEIDTTQIHDILCSRKLWQKKFSKNKPTITSCYVDSSDEMFSLVC